MLDGVEPHHLHLLGRLGLLLDHVVLHGQLLPLEFLARGKVVDLVSDPGHLDGVFSFVLDSLCDRVVNLDFIFRLLTIKLVLESKDVILVIDFSSDQSFLLFSIERGLADDEGLFGALDILLEVDDISSLFGSGVDLAVVHDSFVGDNGLVESLDGKLSVHLKSLYLGGLHVLFTELGLDILEKGA